VDDSPLILRLVEAIARSRGVPARTFERPLEALARVLEARRTAPGDTGPGDLPALMLIDADMPGMGGVDLIRLCRRAGYDGRLYLHSATLDRPTLRHAARAGASGVIAKDDTRRLLPLLLSGAGLGRPLPHAA
jgi:CheY-like chemotaxis protein